MLIKLNLKFEKSNTWLFTDFTASIQLFGALRHIKPQDMINILRELYWLDYGLYDRGIVVRFPVGARDNAVC